MKKLEKKELQTIKGGINEDCQYCYDDYLACLASGTLRSVCVVQRRRCLVDCTCGSGGTICP